MNVDYAKVRISWDNIKSIIYEHKDELFINHIDIKYDNDILKIRIKLNKFNVPVSVSIDNIYCDSGLIKIHIKDMSVFLKFSGKLKNIIIKKFAKGQIKYHEVSETLVIEKEAFMKFIPYADFDIDTISINSDFLDIEVSNIEINKDDTDYKDGGGEGKIIPLADDYIIEGGCDNDYEAFDIKKAQDHYDTIRQKIESYTKSNVPKKYHWVIPYILLLPDTFALLIRLFKDERVKMEDKVMVAIAITYIVSPIDVIPDFFMPFGLLDDLGAALFILDKLVLSVPEEVLKDNFSGEGKVVDFIKGNLRKLKEFVPEINMNKIVAMLNRMMRKKTVVN